MGGSTFGLTFLHPRWFVLLAVVVPALWLVHWAWPAAVRGRRSLLSPVARTLLLAGLLATLAHPVLVHDQARVFAVALVDVSASVSDGQLERARTLVRGLSAAAKPPHSLRVVPFAASPVASTAITPTASVWPRPPRPQTMETDIARALGVAAGLGDAASTRRVVLLSDGRATRGDALAQAGHLAALHIRVDVVDLAADASAGGDAVGDVAVDAVLAPEVQPHATFPLSIRLLADRPTEARLTLRRDGRTMDATRTVKLSAGQTTTTWDTRVESSQPAVFAVEVQAMGDAHPENDRGVVAVAPRTRPQVLILAAAASDVAPLARALGAQSMDVEVVEPTRVALVAPVAAPSAPAGPLARADLVVLADLPRAALSDAAVAALGGYVRDGGGLLVTGGPHAFGPGGWEGSPLASLLPVRMDAPGRRDEPALALALIIDRSGSMSGPKMELTREAARTTAGLLPVDDQIAVVAFDSQATTVVPMQRAANRMRIFNDIGRIQPTGGTNILAGLREGIDALTAARARKKHAILLTDGQSATEGISELVDAAAGSGITISAVGVGDGADDTLLQSIARRGGGRYYRTRDPATIPRIFSRETTEVASTTVVERPTAVIARKHAAMLEGLPIQHAPRLGGYVRTHARADADLLLVTGDGDPVLVRWSVGLGQVAAWTSDLGPRWAETWTRWPPFAKFWGQVARGTMRARAARQAPLLARLDHVGDAVDITVDAVGDRDQFLSGLDARLDITAVGADGTLSPARRQAAMTESAPGRYQAHVSIGAVGANAANNRPAALLLRAVLADAGRPAIEAAGQVSIPFAPELRPVIAPTGAALLAAIAARTGGQTLTAPADLFGAALPRRTTQSLRVPLLLILAALLVVDVAIRRLARPTG